MDNYKYQCTYTKYNYTYSRIYNYISDMNYFQIFVSIFSI